MTKVTRLVALKPCSFGGRKFYIGDEIPVELVVNPQAQQKLGVLAIVDFDSEVTVIDNNIVIPETKLSILVQRGDGEEMTLEPTDRGIQDVFTVLIGKADNAEAIINEMDDGDALILLHLSDPRKSVKAAAEARAKAIASEAEERAKEITGEE